MSDSDPRSTISPSDRPPHRFPSFGSVEEERRHRKQRLAAAFRRPLDPLTQDSCAFYGDHAVFEDFTGVVLDVEEGKRIAHALGDGKAVILSNHGNLTVGTTSVDEAAWWFITMERTCQAQLLVQSANLEPTLIDPDQAAKTFTQVGSPIAGWFSFQPLYEWIVALQPDLLDE